VGRYSIVVVDTDVDGTPVPRVNVRETVDNLRWCWAIHLSGLEIFYHSAVGGRRCVGGGACQLLIVGEC